MAQADILFLQQGAPALLFQDSIIPTDLGTYTGARDVLIRQDQPNTNFADGVSDVTSIPFLGDFGPTSVIGTDRDGTGMSTTRVASLLYFDFDGLLPSNLTNVANATLTLRFREAGSRMIINQVRDGFAWDDTDTWNSFTGNGPNNRIGPSYDNSVARIFVDDAVDGESIDIDVTDIVQNWVNGDTNNGFIFRQNGQNPNDIIGVNNEYLAFSAPLPLNNSPSLLIEVVPEPGHIIAAISALGLVPVFWLRRRKQKRAC